MKKTVAVILALALVLSVLSGCVEKKIFDIQTGKIVSGGETETSAGSEKPKSKFGTNSSSASRSIGDSEVYGTFSELVGIMYIWNDAILGLTEISTNSEEWGEDLSEPKGQWVMLSLTITEGQIPVADLQGLLSEQVVTLEDELPVTYSANGIRIEGDEALAVGTVNLFFDADKDLSIENAMIKVLTDWNP